MMISKTMPLLPSTRSPILFQLCYRRSRGADADLGRGARAPPFVRRPRPRLVPGRPARCLSAVRSRSMLARGACCRAASLFDSPTLVGVTAYDLSMMSMIRSRKH